MGNSRFVTGGAILPAPACDLLDRFTAELDVGFTLTDLHGAVVASTGGAVAGRVDAAAAELARAPAGPEADAPAGDRLYFPVQLGGRRAGILIVHATGERAALAGPVVATALGLALDFAEAAASIGGDRINPGWVLRGLLRGTRHEAERARVVSSIYGWNLFVQRVALVVVAPAADLRRSPASALDPLGAIRGILGSDAPRTPFGQVHETEWVVLVKHDRGDAWSRVVQLAEAIHASMAQGGVRASVGIGEPHLPVSRVMAARRSYREALYAARLGPRLSGKPGVFELRALGAAAFFAPSGPSRQHLASLVLAPLRDQPAVLATLATYLASDMSVSDTALHLDLHRHTVRNHLERVFSLTGLDPRTLEGALELKLALLVATSDPDAPVEDR